MLGVSGLSSASKIALLNAKYMAHRLSGHYNLQFKNGNGHVAHRLLIDLAKFDKAAGTKVTHFAKRLQMAQATAVDNEVETDEESENIEGKFKRTFLHYSDRDIYATTDLIDDETATTASDVHPQLLQMIYPRADDDGAQALAQHYQELARRERTVIDVEHAAELLLSSETDSKPITPGTWVRIQHRHGRYARALAYVERVHEDRLIIWAKVQLTGASSTSHVHLPSGLVAVQSTVDGKISGSRKKDTALLVRKGIIKDGLIRLRSEAHFVISLTDTPHEDELALFIEIPWIPSEARKEIISRAYIATLAVDDRVRVVSGQLVGLEGSIQSIQDSIAEIAVDIRPIGAATVELAALWRLHMLGDKVEVVRGAHCGSRGFILSIQMNELNLCLHGSNQQITVECFNVIMDYKPTARNPIPISYNQTSQVVINPMEIESHESQSIRVSRQERNPYIGQWVIVISGAWKGHRGLLKFVYNQHHQVQLEAPQGRVKLYVAKELALYRDSGRIIPLVNNQNGTVEPDWPLEPEMETPALDDGSSTSLPIPEPSDNTHYEPAWDPASTEADVEFAALQRRLTADLAALQPPVTTDDVPHEPICVTTERLPSHE
ncbi:uncharacterized protein LAESUDRAFT_769403 [Laetiporus sulphureus 93-53]|uniref:KOW domain-containing protein n=1 Tax=Laetiporus sulphureus 93-53 TaxID=1314785 RepID=A0A165AX52_9APHY|nr:uncharacterized protein LAESUDRAFT_769403 [Laetiporus sulphureus 93-53]KZS99821.1 hypothetical protein LAESUDRAFT_769403 [Laetiporus sulphureus 93-53]